MVHCTKCGSEIDPHKNSGHYEKVTGYIKLRPRGANEVKLRESLGEFICRECMDLVMSGLVGQGSLFDD